MSHPSQDAAFRQLFDAHHRTIRAYCCRRLPIWQADDAAAEVFVVVWRRMDDLPDGPEQRMWLFGIARNVVRNARRSMERARRLESRLWTQAQAMSLSAETIVVDSEEDRRLLATIRRLRETEQEILLLRVWEELSSSEIAQVMDITPKAVDNRLARIRKKLARSVADPSTVKIDPHPIAEGGEQ